MGQSAILVGREQERRDLDALTARAANGLSSELVIRGEPGIGKTALVEDLIASNETMQVVRVAGAESEMGLPYAALHRLLLPHLDRRILLPEAQREAIESAFGLISGVAPNLFMVGLGTLTLLADLAQEAPPLLCLIDDAHWLDEASLNVLAFVARRLLADGIVLLFCIRDQADRTLPLDTFSELHLGGLNEDDAHSLLDSTEDQIERHVAQRIVDASGGNPLALTEFARGLSADELAGDLIAPEPLPLSRRLEEHFLRRIQLLDPNIQRFLLIAAAEESGNLDLLRRAADDIGLTWDDIIETNLDEFVTVRPSVVFRHPLIRSAVYAGSSPVLRREIHRALGRATDRASDPERRAWHMAAAASGPDETVASELERSASGARQRGGYAAEAAFLARAAELSPDARRRGSRLLDAAAAALQAGDLTRSQALLAQADPLLNDALQRAKTTRLRGATLKQLGRYGEAPFVLSCAAQMFEPIASRLARDTWFETLDAALDGLSLMQGTSLTEVADRILAAPHAPSRENAIDDLLLEGFATRIGVGYADAVPILNEAIEAVSSSNALSDGLAHVPILVSMAISELWDLDRGIDALTRLAERERDRGGLIGLRYNLHAMCTHEVWAGRVSEAEVHFEQALELSRAVGVDPFRDLMEFQFQAVRGQEAEAKATVKEAIELAQALGIASVINMCHCSLAVLAISQGRYHEGLRYARDLCKEDAPGYGCRMLPELIEASIRSGEIETARNAMARLADRASASGTQWALGLLSRSRGILDPSGDAELHFTEAIARLENAAIPLDLSRAHLLYGEWLRRRRRGTQARQQLETAFDMFTAIGAEGFAGRTAKELRAVGARTRRRPDDVRSELTPQEQQVVRLAATRATNAEIAAELFISQSTVAYHLRKAFRKLGVTSRRQLDEASTLR